MLDSLKMLWSRWKVQVTFAGGVLVVATAFGTCSYDPEQVSSVVEEVTPTTTAVGATVETETVEVSGNTLETETVTETVEVTDNAAATETETVELSGGTH